MQFSIIMFFTPLVWAIGVSISLAGAISFRSYERIMETCVNSVISAYYSTHMVIKYGHNQKIVFTIIT